MKSGKALLAAATAAVLAATAVAGDPPAPAASPEDVYAAALARARSVEQQLVTTVDTICQSSVTVLNLKIPKEQPGQPVSREPKLDSGGSGVLITRNNKTWILTNVHVIEGADRINVVTRDGVTREVVVEDAVKQYDIALLRFTDPKTTGLKCVTVVGKKSAELEEGQWCIATGNPFFLANDGVPAVSLGVISGLDRVIGGGSGPTYGRAIQHDAAVNHGNSGGPLWNLRGEFVGINGMIASIPLVDGATTANTGASYAIPVEEIEVFLGQLVDAKKDARAGFLGVAVETDTDPKTGKPVGARVTGLDPRSPANGPKGLKVNDVIEKISCAGNSVAIKTESELVNALSLCPAGSRVLISYKRLGKASIWTGELAASQ